MAASSSSRLTPSPPGSDPQALIEEPFQLEGYVYTFADIVKAENHVSDRADVRGFDQLGFRFRPELSSENRDVFLKEPA